MAAGGNHDFGTETAALDTAIDNLCDRFEAAWNGTAEPSIEQFLLQAAPAAQAAAFRYLLRVELELRGRRGEVKSIAGYQSRFPQFADIVSEVFRNCQVSEVDTISIPSRSLKPGLHVRCPYCHQGIQVATEAAFIKIDCPGCGSAFSLTHEELSSQRDSAKSRVAHFELLERLGSGAFGTVWKARDTQLDRAVAIKIPRRGELTPAEADLFLKEARAAAQLSHRNIVSVHEVGRHVTEHESTVYIVSDLITGMSLDQWMEGQQLTSVEAARLVATIAEALEHAHQRGVIHRDLKPQNILIDAIGEPHITDFGLAKREAGEITMTAEGQIVGTPAYMSPEQAQGDSHSADRSSDVYSLGVILFQLLSQELPFRGSVRMVIHQVIHDEPPSPRRFRSTIPKDLETITLKCLEKDRRKRYASALELNQDLHRFLNYEPIQARPVSSWERGWRFCRRHAAATSFSAALVVAILSGFLAVTWQWRKTVAAQSGRTTAQLNGLMTAEPAAVPDRLADLAPFRKEVITELHELLNDVTVPEQQKTRIRLLILPEEESQIDALLASWSKVDFEEFQLIRDQLLPYHKKFEEILWQQVDASNQLASANRFRTLLFLAGVADAGAKWSPYAEFVTDEFIKTVRTDPRQYGAISDMLRPVRKEMLRALFAIYTQPTYPQSDRQIAMNTLCEYAEVSNGSGQGDSTANRVTLCEALLEAEPWQFPVVLSAIERADASKAIRDLRESLATEKTQLNNLAEAEHQAKRAANAALARIALGDFNGARQILAAYEDQSARCYFISRYPKIGIPADPLVALFSVESDVAVKRAILLCLGAIPRREFQKEAFNAVRTRLLQVFRNDTDPGMHAAARWTLTQWGADEVASIEAKLRGPELAQVGDKEWYVNSAGHTMLVFDSCEFEMGSPAMEQGRYPEVETQHRRRIDRRFAISMLETTNAQFVELATSVRPPGDDCTEENCPVHAISWLQAAEYCNLLSKREGIPEDQWCYVRNETTGELDAADNALTRSGYRLPTEAEWEYVCRAGTTTARFFGQSDELLGDYAWCLSNSPKGSKQPVGRLRPNDFGVFDIYGNAIEWCHDWFQPYPQQTAQPVIDDDTNAFGNGIGAASVYRTRVLRGSAAGDADGFRSAFRDRAPHDQPGANAIGFRVAKTVITQ